MTLELPAFSLVLLIGASGSGKSSFARKHFRPSEVLSSDFCRGLVSDDENDQSATADAFELLRFIALKRLERRRLTVIDATNVQFKARRRLIELARDKNAPAIAIVLDLPAEICQARNLSRTDRYLAPQSIADQLLWLRDSSATLDGEGFQRIYVLRTPLEAETCAITYSTL